MFLWLWQREAIPWMGRTAITPILGPELPQRPGETSNAASSRLSRTRVGPSPPSSRVFHTTTEFSLFLLGLGPPPWPHSPKSARVALSTGSPLLGSFTSMMSWRGGMPLRTSVVVTGRRFLARVDQSPSSAHPTVLLCILAVQRPHHVLVLGGSSRHLGLFSHRRTGLPLVHLIKMPRLHSGVVPSSPVGDQGILTITLSPADQSRRVGWDEGSSPLSIASSRSPCGSAATSLPIGLALLAP